ncbi:hypothetical protein NQ318_017639 [Aromia moschata]|uniref:DUF4817 domain-containing protein n=1 Tax=Aromia moschata TaxID=1265417 RepID=A0AAV8Z1F4_9CUCU|nr:hypothetical protein NQ318_017639 [Aromia moschata]
MSGDNRNGVAINECRTFYGRRDDPSKSILQRLVAKFETTGSVNNLSTLVRERKARSAENIDAVRISVQENSRQSIPRRAQELGLSQTSTWRILRRDLGLHPYKIQLTQKLKSYLTRCLLFKFAKRGEWGLTNKIITNYNP